MDYRKILIAWNFQGSSWLGTEYPKLCDGTIAVILAKLWGYTEQEIRVLEEMKFWYKNNVLLDVNTRV